MSELMNIIETAERDALEDGYDRVIYMTKQKKMKVSTLASVPNIRTENVVGYVRLYYKDKELFTRYIKGGYTQKNTNKRNTAIKTQEDVYRPRMEIYNKKEVKDIWYEWGNYETEQDAIIIAKKIQKEIIDGKWNDRKEYCKDNDILRMSVEKTVVNKNKRRIEIIEI